MGGKMRVESFLPEVSRGSYHPGSAGAASPITAICNGHIHAHE